MVYRYPHPEYFDFADKPDWKRLSGNLLLWGAGKAATVAAHCLKQRGVGFIAFVDIARDRWGTEYCGHRIISPDELKRDYPNAAVAVSASYPSAICAQLRELGYDDSLDCSSLFMEIDFDGYDAYMTPEFAARISENYLRNILLHYRRGPLIERLFVMINNKCSLRCKNCDAYIPYVKDAVNYDFGRIVESCQCALDAVGGVDTVDILGGEPMLHDRLSEILRYFIENPSVSRVTLITNGTILPGAELVETMKSPKFVCRLSNYGKHSRRLGEIAALLGANAIRSEMTNYSQWDALPALSATNETRRELDAKFASCTANLFYLQDGKLFYCNVVASLTCNVRTDVLPPSPDDYLDLYEGECGGLRPDAKERIAAFAARLHTRRHIGACKYCTGSHCLQFENKVPVAEQTKERLEMPRAY